MVSNRRIVLVVRSGFYSFVSNRHYTKLASDYLQKNYYTATNSMASLSCFTLRTDGQTDRQTTYSLCVANHQKY
jgi:hypothetical protein